MRKIELLPKYTSKNGVQRYLGLTSHFLRFIKKLAVAKAPINAWTSMRRSSTWAEKSKSRSKNLKRRHGPLQYLCFRMSKDIYNENKWIWSIFLRILVPKGWNMEPIPLPNRNKTLTNPRRRQFLCEKEISDVFLHWKSIASIFYH